MRQRKATAAAAAWLLLLCSGAHGAETEENDADLRRAMEDMRQRMEEMERRHRRELDDLRAELDAAGAGEGTSVKFERELDALIHRMDTFEADIMQRTPKRDRAWIDISLHALIAAGTATEDDEIISQLQGGGHDPSGRGFTVQNVELSLSGGVGDVFESQAYITHTIDSEGETETELEEAYVETISLPHGLAVKVGHYYTPLGAHNPQHPHAWEFVDAPVMNTRFLGPDGMRGTGAQVSWRAPTHTPIELTFGIQNADGETMTSFVGVPDEEEGGHHAGGENSVVGELRESLVHSLDDMVYSGRVTLDLEDDHHDHRTLFGASAAIGPNASGGDTDTTFLGFDVTHRWQPHEAADGFPFVQVRLDTLWRLFEFDDFVDDHDGDSVRGRTLRDHGLSLQAVWGFEPGWTLGGRFDYVDAELDVEEPGLDDRKRWSLALTHPLGDSAQIRFQVNHDDADSLDDTVTSFWFQLEWHLGAPAAHDGHDH